MMRSSRRAWRGPREGTRHGDAVGCSPRRWCDGEADKRSGVAVFPRRRCAPVVVGGLEVLLQHEGGTGSEEGPMVEDDDGHRWEFTMRGLKRQRRLRFPGGVVATPAAKVDRRQGGGRGCSRRAPCEEKGARGEKLGPAATDAF
jgi:hypothetical protein